MCPQCGMLGLYSATLDRLECLKSWCTLYDWLLDCLINITYVWEMLKIDTMHQPCIQLCRSLSTSSCIVLFLINVIVYSCVSHIDYPHIPLWLSCVLNCCICACCASKVFCSERCMLLSLIWRFVFWFSLSSLSLASLASDMFCNRFSCCSSWTCDSLIIRCWSLSNFAFMCSSCMILRYETNSIQYYIYINTYMKDTPTIALWSSFDCWIWCSNSIFSLWNEGGNGHQLSTVCKYYILCMCMS